MDISESWVDDEMRNSVHRWESMQKSHQRCFFDVDELEDIIDYYLGTENIVQATIAADYAVGLYPTATSIQLRLADILIDNGQPAKALSLLNKLEPLETNEYAIYLLKGTALNQLGKAREAQRQFEKALALADEDQAPALYEIGMSFARIDQFGIALKYFQKAHDMEPDNPYVSYDMALCYDRLGESEKSIALYLKFLDEEPFAEYAWYNLGVVYSRKEDDLKALEAYDYALAIDPKYSSAIFNKANTLSILNRNTEAIECFKDFIKLEPDNVAGYCYLGECYDNVGDPNNAALLYGKALSIDNTFADAWYGLALLKMDIDKYEEALPLLLKAIELDKDNPEFLLSLASTYANVGEFELAGNLFKRLLRTHPDEEEVWDCYAQHFAQQKRYLEAQNVAIEGIKRIHDSILLRYHLAVFYLLNDDRLQGLTILKETYTAYPDDINLFVELFEMIITDEEIWILVQDVLNHRP